MLVTENSVALADHTNHPDRLSQ